MTTPAKTARSRPASRNAAALALGLVALGATLAGCNRNQNEAPRTGSDSMTSSPASSSMMPSASSSDSAMRSPMSSASAASQ